MTQLSNGRREKRPWQYVPWVALVAFLFIFVGIIVWATGMNTALSNTNAALAALFVEAEGYIDTIHSAAVAAVVVCALMSAVMVLMSGGRTCLEKAVDERGKAVCGSWLWLATEAILCVVWWLILFWLVFVIFGSCLWYGATYTVRGVLEVSINTASAVHNVTAAYMPPSPPPPLPAPPLPSIMPLAALATPPPSVPFTCDNNCLNLAIFDFIVQKDICVCAMDQLQKSYDHTKKAYKALGNVVAGSFLMWVGASFLLMNAVAEFSKTKRERELLLRAQRAAVDNAATQMALGQPGGAQGMYPNSYQGDTLPLLKTQQMQQQALQQQQMQMQMQMMAQAQATHQAAHQGRPPAPSSGSRGNLGSAV